MRNVRWVRGIVAVAALILIVAWANRGESPWPRASVATQQPSAASSVLKSGDITDALAANAKISMIEKPNGKHITADPILETHLQRAQQQHDFEILSQKSLPLHAKDKLQFHVKLNAPSHVYLFLIDTKGMPTRLWPETAQDLEQQKPVTELWSPPLAGEGQKQKMYFLDALQGQETVLVATSQRPLSQADLQIVESVRLNLARTVGDKRQLVSFRREERERGFGGIVETDKVLSVEIDSFTERLDLVFDGYTGIVFPHE